MIDFDKIKEINTKVANLRQEIVDFRKQIRDIALAAFSDLFTELPELESFSWTQYAPYFNDGDPCVFNVHTSDLYINGINEYGENINYDRFDDGDEAYEKAEEAYEKAEAEWKKMGPSIMKVLNLLETDDFEELWGSDGLVTVTAKGITVSEYSHD